MFANSFTDCDIMFVVRKLNNQSRSFGSFLLCCPYNYLYHDVMVKLDQSDYSNINWILSRTSGGALCRTSAPQTSAHAPLLVKHSRRPVLPLPAYVRLQNIKLTRVRCHGTSCIYTASGPSALGCVNHAAPLDTESRDLRDLERRG